MFPRKIIYTILLCLFIVSFILAFIIFQIKNNSLQIVFLDVGQGDSILIMQGSQQILIDGGKDGKLLLGKLGKYIPFWDRNIEMISLSHPDQDHIGGLANVLRTYKVNNVLETNAQSESETYKNLQKEIDAEGMQKIEAKRNVKIIFPNGAVAEVLYPFGSLPNEIDKQTNEHSVVLRLSYGNNSFLFTGDLPITSEDEILKQKIDLSADVIKIAHHGSRYSTNSEFLDAIKPQTAIISVGKNSYGHPNQEILQRLFQHNIDTLRTDEVGDIVYDCKSVNNKCMRNH